jgi:hypothetical protein
VIAVEPKNVSALLGHEPGLHKIQESVTALFPKYWMSASLTRLLRSRMMMRF